MKKSILTFFTLLFLLSGMSSSASDGTIKMGSDLETWSVAVPMNPIQLKDTAFQATSPNFTILLLIGIGLIGLVGVNRENKL